MKSSVEPLEGNKVKVQVQVDEAEFDKDLDAAFARLAKQVRLPGFRPGKAPRKVIEARIGQGYAREEAFREALPEYYTKAVIEHEVDVISPPEIDITDGQDEGGVVFDAVVEVRPAITVDGYQDLEVEIPSPLVTDEDVDEQIDRMRERSGELQEVERAAQAGDRVTIDIECSHEGELVEGLTTTGYNYEVGTGAVVDELDDNLTGASAGDHLEFEAEHPQDPEAEPLQFVIDVTAVNEMVLPEADDDWAKENSEFMTLEGLRENIRESTANSRREAAANARSAAIGEAIADLVDDTQVPGAMVDNEVDNRAQDMAMRLESQGIPLETYLQITGQSQQDLVEELRDGARGSAKLDLALRAIAVAENLEVDDETLEEQFAEAGERVGRSAADLRQEFADTGRLSAVRSDLQKAKAFEFVIERARLVDPEGNEIDAKLLEEPDEDESEEE